MRAAHVGGRHHCEHVGLYSVRKEVLAADVHQRNEMIGQVLKDHSGLTLEE